jgi:hypothetical protein
MGRVYENGHYVSKETTARVRVMMTIARNKAYPTKMLNTTSSLEEEVVVVSDHHLIMPSFILFSVISPDNQNCN